MAPLFFAPVRVDNYCPCRAQGMRTHFGGIYCPTQRCKNHDTFVPMQAAGPFPSNFVLGGIGHEKNNFKTFLANNPFFAQVVSGNCSAKFPHGTPVQYTLWPPRLLLHTTFRHCDIAAPIAHANSSEPLRPSKVHHRTKLNKGGNILRCAAPTSFTPEFVRRIVAKHNHIVGATAASTNRKRSSAEMCLFVGTCR